MSTCWEILGLEPTASAEEVKQSYRRLAAGAHPDIGGSSEAFIRLNVAYRAALAAAAEPLLCPECAGLGVIPTQRGWHTVMQHCRRCRGAGVIERGNPEGGRP